MQQQIDIQPQVSSTNFLPTFLTAPSAATIAGLTQTLAQHPGCHSAHYSCVYSVLVLPAPSPHSSPYGQSIYHGLQTQVTRSYSNGLQLLAAYTYSHADDNSTADVFSTLLTPRRPQNSQNFAADMSTSALDRRQRLSLEAIYNVPFFKGSSNWMAKNLLGNWELAPQWQLQSPEFYTPQSGPLAIRLRNRERALHLGAGQDSNRTATSLQTAPSLKAGVPGSAQLPPATSS